MRVVRLTRAHPVGAVLHVITDVDRARRGEFVPLRTARGHPRGTRQEVILGGGGASRDVLRCAQLNVRIVVPAARTNVRVLVILVEKQRSTRRRRWRRSGYGDARGSRLSGARRSDGRIARSNTTDDATRIDGCRCRVAACPANGLARHHVAVLIFHRRLQCDSRTGDH